MRKFKNFLIEETLLQILIVEGKAQHQLIRQFGDKILQRMEDESKSGPNRAIYRAPVNLDPESMRAKRYIVGTSHYKLLGGEVPDSVNGLEPNHGSPEHKTSYIMKQLSIPEAPDYLDVSDPDDNKTWNQHVNWILSRYAQGGGIVRMEDIPNRAIPTLAKYHKLVKRGKMDAVSLAKWKNLTDMETAVQNADPLEASNLDSSEYTLHDENEHWSLVTPHTNEAACALGHGSHWCTTSGAFEDYSSMGPLYIMIPKKPKEKNEKYQLHIETEQFMDKMDSSFDDDAVFKNRTMTPKMEALVKLHKTNENLEHNFTQDQLDFLINNHLGQMLRHPNKDISEAAANHTNFGSKPEHIKYALESRHESVAKAAVNHPFFGYGEGDINTALRSPHESIAKAAVNHPNFGDGMDHNYHDIGTALKSPHESVQQVAVNHPNFGLEDYHFENAFKSPHESVQQVAVNHPKFGSDYLHFDSALKSPHRSIQLAAVNHPKFTESERNLDFALLSKYEDIQRAGIEHPGFGSRSVHIDEALRSEFKPIQEAGINHPNFGADSHFTNAIGWGEESIARQAINHPRFSPKLVRNHFDVFSDSPHSFIRKLAIDHINNMDSKDLSSRNNFSKALQSSYEDVAQAAAKHLTFDSRGYGEYFRTAIKSPHESVSLAAINHPDFDDTLHISYAFLSPHESVQLAGVNNPKFNFESINSAVSSPHESVAQAAVNHPEFGYVEDHISYALTSPHKSIHQAAIKQPKFGSAFVHLSRGLDSPYEEIQLATVNHPRFARDEGTLVKDALQSPHESVRKRAKEIFDANERKKNQ